MRDFGDVLRIHHCFSKESLSKDRFEYAFERILNQCGKRAALAANGRAKPVGSNTTSDWAFLGDLPAVKMGPGDTHRSHRPDEYLAATELDEGIACYTRLTHAFFEAAA